MWNHNTLCGVELSRNKEPSEGEDLTSWKVSKPLELHESDEPVKVLHNHSMLNSENTDNHHHVGSQSNLSVLFYQLGRDSSIECLLHCSRFDYGVIASLNQGFRSLIRSGELYRVRRKMGIVEHCIYFSCILLKWEAFDPIRCRWMNLPTITSADVCFMCTSKQLLAVGTELLVFGKEINSPVIFKYSILTNTWSSGMNMRTPRFSFASASLGEIAILAGGCDLCGNILSSVELYNSESGSWLNLPSMNKSRKFCTGVFMDGNFYVIGGIGEGNSKRLTCGEVYDPKTRTWHVIPDMFPRRRAWSNETQAGADAPPLIAVVKNELFAADHTRMEVQKYVKEKNVWVTLGRLPEQALSVNGWGLAFKGCGDRLILIAGTSSLNGGIVEINSWIPGDGPPRWNLLGSKPFGSFVYNCAVMEC
ncbi:Galactose oxidase/kelch repeat superfamily protein [Tripterygium wilfordii]|uniref:Galactose oxidase/kelch repeat superfamily protein n=1 Tax=Tripterygium wilfordii TaxID=458696 RepID=A0A7J7C883_TRIWF|nr:F-box/kelch-repeat protein SKIP11-like [Tripterygium wilfordii]XP_038687131.1 F-box/kelch-repeat protein SKIP11-like [Tripterygium wilfordii]XP_038687132.1 F-box/kelch-repeat protein SKIP11-like [Tripterygium wilfordii]KAF5730145.1 Galactose oxidase/kelch repeat superfamily protein [Tripterygium wilfordii]